MFLLSYVLIGSYFVMLWPYGFKSLRLNENGEIRSISAMICQLRPVGHFLMSLMNLIVFEIISLEHKEVAWAYWCALQLVLCFDMDENQKLHLLFLLVYIAMLLLFWGFVTANHDIVNWVIPMWVLTGLFTTIWFFNMLLAWYHARRKPPAWRDLLGSAKQPLQPERWKYESLQSVVEILWVGSVGIATWRYEYILRSDLGVKSDSYSI